MPEITAYADAFYPMTWLGPEGYPTQANGGRCYFTGILGMLSLHGETDLLFADGISGDGFSFRWSPVWGAPAFNGGRGAFHELWEYTASALGYRCHWQEDAEGGWDESFETLRSVIDRGIPVQVGLHYSRVWPHGTATSPRLAHAARFLGPTGFGHHVVIAGYDMARGTVTVYEPNDIMPHARYECPIADFRLAWEEANQRTGDGYAAWAHHHPWGGAWSLHDGYGPYQMAWIEPGRDPNWSIHAAIRDSFRRNLKILRGEYPKPYMMFGSQWQIPHWETGAPGMARFATLLREGKVADPVAPNGESRPLFVRGQIPNHGVLGRAGAAGYLRRVAQEIRTLGMRSADDVAQAAQEMQTSSDLFREIRYIADLPQAAALLTRIADAELRALSSMEQAWGEIRTLPAQRATLALAAE
jgi:hypothetical protein